MSLHIDGTANALQISKKAEVDMEMVRACLRVLSHHGVIALVDMFFYSNRYECTEKVASLFSENDKGKLLQKAILLLPPPDPAARGLSCFPLRPVPVY